MKSSSYLRLLVALVITGIISLSEGSAQGSKPPKILVSPPPGQVVWDITYKYKIDFRSQVESSGTTDEERAANSAVIARPSKMVFVIKKGLASRSTTYENGDKEEAYQYENFEFEKRRDVEEPIKYDLKVFADAPEKQFQKKFLGMEWVKPKHFVKVEDAYGQSCAYFLKSAKTAEIVDNENEDDRDTDRKAWFSMTTGLPVAFQEGGTIGIYTFADPATATITVPNDIRKKIEDFAESVAYQKRRSAPERSR